MKATTDYNLGKLHPKLARQWHPTKNRGLKPYDVAPGSHKRVWWKCDQGHEWEVTVNSRIYKGSGCPKCYNEERGEKIRKAALKKSGSLADQYPELVKEWHPTKNRDLTPHQLPVS